jgi:BirA family biotin operon repressor/biotin-[acetyl-CoA-carboxylase] ligase
MDKLQAKLAAPGSVYFAHHQTAGKGQMGKNWETQAGVNLTMSVILDCSLLNISQQFALSVVAALACFDLFSQYAGDETSIKWPNDLYWRDRKAGGILIENQVRGHIWQTAVVGIGLNLNQTDFPASLKNPVSLKQITGKQENPVLMAKELLVFLQTRYTALLRGESVNQLDEYNLHLYKRGEQVKLKSGSILFPCTIEKVNEAGELEISGWMKDRLVFGEVEWVMTT